MSDSNMAGFIKIERGFLSKAECERFIARFSDPNQSEAVATFWRGKEKIIKKEVRDSYLIWVPHEEEPDISDRIMKAYGFPDLKYKDKMQLTRYKIGGHYKVHPDYVGEQNPRKMSFACLLSDPKTFEGGRFFFRDAKVEVSLGQGDAVIFDSKLWHGVEPVTSGERYSLVVWAI